jgi:hypothetical protein
MKDTEEFSKEGLPLPKIFTAEGSSCLAEQCNVFNSRELNLGDFETLKGDSSQAIAHGKRKLKKKKNRLTRLHGYRKYSWKKTFLLFYQIGIFYMKVLDEFTFNSDPRGFSFLNQGAEIHFH